MEFRRVLFRSLRAGFAMILLASCGDNGSQAQQQAALPPPTVTVAKPVMREIVEDDEFVGRFEAIDEVEVRARVGGYLEKVHFTDGVIVREELGRASGRERVCQVGEISVV